jgi:hypothetical protein
MAQTSILKTKNTMGDRGNIIIRATTGSNRDDIWLYTHWGGSELEETLRRALARKQRWGDASYLARIIFCELMGKDTSGETGFGISTSQCDNEYDRLMVDVESQVVYAVPEPGSERKGLVRLPDNLDAKNTVGVWTFDEFIAGVRPTASPTK